MRRALTIDEDSFGADHPRLAIRLHNLALLLQAANRPAEAEPMIRKAVEIFQASLGSEDPRTLNAKESLGSILVETAGEDSGAEL
jgi:hypothetical protein